MKRAVGYVRVSLTEQVDGHSLQAQRREIARYSERHGLDLQHVYADEGVSAHSDQIDKRPQLAALLRDAERGAVDVVIVHTLDRWARNIRVQSEALQRLGSAGVGFASVTEGVDFSTPAGRMMLTMMGGVSEFFSDQLAIHVVKGQRQRAESGLPMGSIPFGYVIDEPGDVPRTDERPGEAVRQVFVMRAAGWTNGEIAEWLNREGFRTRTGRMFTAHAVKDLLNCRFYLGVVTFRGEEFPGQHEALVDETTFELAQRRRTPRGGHRKAVDRPRGVLAGMIRCCRCGNPLHADRNAAGSPLYRERHGWKCETNPRALVAHPVDEQMGEVFGAIRLREDWRDRIARAATMHDGPSMTALLERRRRLVRAYGDGGAYTEAEYEGKLAAIDREIRALENDAPVRVEEVAMVLRDLPGLWSEARPDERRRLLAPFVTGVYVDVDAKRVAGLVPEATFGSLLAEAIEQVPGAPVVLLPPGGSESGTGGDGGESNS